MPVSGSVIELNPHEPPKFLLAPIPITLQWVHEIVGDWTVCAFRIELPDRRWWLSGWVDDMGLLKDQPLNFMRWKANGDPIVGKCVITREARDPSGKLAPVNDQDMELIKRMLHGPIDVLHQTKEGAIMEQSRVLRPPPGMGTG